MSKTAISTLITRVGRRADYDITATDEDLSNLIVDCINDGLKRLKQMFLDYNLLDEIGTSTTLSTTASQNYVDISTTTDLDEIIVSSERTNDRTIEIIPYLDFVKMYPDPDSSTGSIPFHAARYDNKLYLGPTPSAAITLYFDYVKLLSDVTSASTSPFESKYDPIIIAMAKTEIMEWLDRNTRTIQASRDREAILINDLIKGASVNIDLNRQSASRRGGLPLEPQIPGEGVNIGYGYGVGIYGSGGYGR